MLLTAAPVRGDMEGMEGGNLTRACCGEYGECSERVACGACCVWCVCAWLLFLEGNSLLSTVQKED